jgi:7,8-dihydropterin-6-yl-methyl-4-(beta-D-ribofuranosyl)aminobenzene 5'-phosphate synthase
MSILVKKGVHKRKVAIRMIGLASIFLLVSRGGFCEQKNPDGPSVAITVVYDNNEYDPGLETAWGFSCLIKEENNTILFDSGGNGKILLSNMNRLKLDPQQVEVVVLSHIHNDHVGGLEAFLEQNSNVTIYLPHSFPDAFKNKVRKYGAKVINVNKPLRILQNVYSTGELGTEIKEESLIINTEKGLIIITGCAHPGIIEIVRKAKEIMKTNVYLVMGGFHLKGMSQREIDGIVEEFKKQGVEKVGACHCSGDLARKIFEKAYHEDFIRVGVGKIIEID